MADEQDTKTPQDNPKPPSGPTPGPGRNGNSFLSRGAMGWILLAGLALVLLLLVQQAQNAATEVTWRTFKENVANQSFKSIVVEDQKIVGELKADTPGTSVDKAVNKRLSVGISPDTKPLRIAELDSLDASYEEHTSNNLLFTLLVSWGPVILIAFLIYFFVFRSLRNAGGGPGGMLGSFGRSKHKVMNKEHSTVTLNDVAGIEEAKEEVTEIIEFLKNPKKFQRLGGRVPRGVLLCGQPGCGKTLLAKAVAGEADVPFFSISGSDFVEMFVGVGASRVRDLFKQAKDSSPCIIFLDEIDAVGRRRGSGFSSGGHDEREQTLNAILVEMDGFESSDQVIVMAATNRADVLDPALIRPGRFDRQIDVPLPDIKGRMEILQVHARKVKVAKDIDLEKLARGTPMFSGADLEAIINEAAIAATMLSKDFVDQDDLEEARDKVRWGRSRKSHKVEEDEKKIIAYHEAGHALVMVFDEHSEPIHKVTIIPRGQSMGATFMLPEKDRHIYQRKALLSQLRVTYGGRIAEQMFCGDISSGASMDIKQATRIARTMVTQYGMDDDLGFLLYGSDESRSNPWEQSEQSYSDETADKIDHAVRALINRTYQETQELLDQHRDQLDALAQALLKYETLSRDDVDKLMRGEDLSKPTVSDLLAAEKKKALAAPAQETKSSDAEPDDSRDDQTPDIVPTPA